MTEKKRIAVFGGSKCTVQTAEIAEMVGKLLAEKGALVYCGGRSGVMKAVSKGTSEAGGTVVGILPGVDAFGINRYVTVPVATGAGQGRNVMIANSVHGAIAIAGAYGTLSEIAHTLSQNKPVVTLGSWDIKGVNETQTPEGAVQKILELT